MLIQKHLHPPYHRTPVRIFGGERERYYLLHRRRHARDVITCVTVPPQRRQGQPRLVPRPLLPVLAKKKVQE